MLRTLVLVFLALLAPVAAAGQMPLSSLMLMNCPHPPGSASDLVTIEKCVQFLRGQPDIDKASIAEGWLRAAHGYFGIDRVSHNRSRGSASRLLEALDQGIAAAPKHGKLHVMKAAVLEYFDEQAAIVAYDRGIDQAPEYWQVYAGKARFILRRTMHQEAEQLSLKAIEVAPTSPYPHMWHGHLLESFGRFEEARESYRFAYLNEDEGDERALGIYGIELAHLSYARVLQRLGEPAECAKVLSDLIDKKREHLWQDIVMFRARCYEDAKRFEEAATDYEFASRLRGPQKPDELKLKSALARAKTLSGEQAVEDMWTVLEKANMRQILTVQVFLRNNGFDDVNINGKRDDTLKKALTKCALSAKCKSDLNDTI